jgi:hypothetical protein
MLDFTLSEAVKRIKEVGGKPLPLYTDEATDEFYFSSDGPWFRWKNPPEGALETVMTNDSFVLVTRGYRTDGLYLLRDPEEGAGCIRGSVIKVRYQDYVRWSLLYPTDKRVKDEGARDLSFLCLPHHVITWLQARGLTVETVQKYDIKWLGGRIGIPFTMDSGVVSHKLRRDPYLSLIHI